MDDLPPAAKALESLIAPARHSDDPMLYMICQMDGENRGIIYEQLPGGKCPAWPGPSCQGVQQARGRISLAACCSAKKRIHTRPTTILAARALRSRSKRLAVVLAT